MDGFVILAVVLGIAALAALVLLGVELFEKKITKRSVIALCMLLPVHAALVELEIYPTKRFWANQQHAKAKAQAEHVRNKPFTHDKSHNKSHDVAASSATEHISLNASGASSPSPRAVLSKESLYNDPRPNGSVDGFVISYGSKKMAADLPFVFNESGDTLSARCSEALDTLELTLSTDASKLAPNFLRRLNNEQAFVRLFAPTATNQSNRRVSIYNTSIACSSITMVSLQLIKSDTSDVLQELLLYRVTPKPAN